VERRVEQDLQRQVVDAHPAPDRVARVRSPLLPADRSVSGVDPDAVGEAFRERADEAGVNADVHEAATRLQHPDRLGHE
jgi:hypothetical protein